MYLFPVKVLNFFSSRPRPCAPVREMRHPLIVSSYFYSISNIGTWEKVRKNAVQIKTNVSGSG